LVKQHGFAIGEMPDWLGGGGRDEWRRAPLKANGVIEAAEAAVLLGL
jgi:hypothetical protein